MASIVAPEPDLDQPEYGVKRQRSEEQEEAGDGKRRRISPGKNSPPATGDRAATAEDNDKDPLQEEKKLDSPTGTRRKSGAVDEKQRSKRLFGAALLGNLRQPGDRTSKRRQEIESRSKAKLKKQDDERLEDRQRRLEQLQEQRKVVQVKVDEQNMHRRHQAMLDQANFLQTETEPRLFYRPWDLRDDEEDHIDDQIREAKDLIDKEVAELNERQGRSSPMNGAEIKEAEMEDFNYRVEGDAKDEEEAARLIGEEGAAQDQASAKSDHRGTTTTADAPDNIPSTNAEDTDREDNGQIEEVRSVSAGAGAEEGPGDDGEHTSEGDVDAVIY